MNLDLTAVLYDFEGVAFKDQNGKDLSMAKILGSKLLEPGNENVLKFYDWALKLWNEGKLEVDNADLQLLKSVVEKAKDWTVLIKGRILTELNKIN